MDKEEAIKEMKKRLQFLQEEARSKACELGKITRKANEYEKEILKLQNEKTKDKSV